MIRQGGLDLLEGNMLSSRSILMLALCVIFAPDLGNAAPGPANFSYQGQLKFLGVPANGEYDFVFRLHDAVSGGSPVGSPVTVNDWPVSNGLFSVQLDFGASPFDGDARWLGVEVRPGNSPGAYTVLSPRQPLTAAPYALYALSGPGGTESWTQAGSNIHNTNSGNVGIGTSAPTQPLHIAKSVPVLVLQDSDSTTNQVGYVGFNDQGGVQRGWMGFGSSGNAHLSLMNHRAGGSTILGSAGVSRLVLDAAGNVGVGTTAPADRLHVSGSVLASGSLRSTSPGGDAEVFLGWGADSVGADMARIRIGGNSGGAYNGLEIQAVANRSLLRITNAGDVGIGTSDPANRLSVVGSANISNRLGVGLSNPLAPVHVGGGSDASPSGGGYVVTGGTDGLNIAIDNNEIMARNNGAASTLYMNNDGGDVSFGAGVIIGYQIVTGGGSATCPAGTNVIGGGCRIVGNAEVRGSYPASNRWNCEVGDQSGFIELSSYAICARVK